MFKKIFMFIIVTTGLAFSEQTILIKLEHSPLKLGKQSFQAGITHIDAAFTNLGVRNLKPVFSQYMRKPALYQDSDIGRWMTCSVSDGSVDRTIDALSHLQGIEYAAINRVFKLAEMPNDPEISQQWALKKIKAFEAWEIESGSPSVLIAIIDTGIDYQHPDLGANIWINSAEDLNRNGKVDESDFNSIDDDNNGFTDDIQGWDFTDAPNYPDGGDYLERDNDPMDELGHGTAIAGIVSAVTDNGEGIAGVAHHCRVMNIRFATGRGYGEEDDAASAILYAIENNARIINMSWGDTNISRILDDIYRYAVAKGVIMVASAGNSSTDQIHYPSGFGGTISVGATDSKDNLAGFSNYGPSVDLVAPGVSIYTMALDADYTSTNGTSFSAPFVAAAAGLLLSHNPDLNADAVRSILVNSADDLGSAGWDPYFGAGRLNLEKALAQESHAIIKITEPRLDQGFYTAPIQILGSAWSPMFEQYSLAFGLGDNPSQWTEILSHQATPIIDGLLGTWNSLPGADSCYTIRLTVTSRDGFQSHDFVRIFIDRTAPQIQNVNILPMVDGDHFSALVEFITDDLCEGSLFYRPVGSSQNFQETLLSFRTHELRYNLSQTAIADRLDLKVQARNGAGLITEDNHYGSFYSIDLTASPINVVRFTPKGSFIPFGHCINVTSDFNGNGFPELVLAPYQANAVGPVQFFEWNGAELQSVFRTENALIPRDLEDADNDGKAELLCGFGFNSYLYKSEINGQFPSVLMKQWQGDGGLQYWASRITDLDRDDKSEVILRVVRPGENSNAATDQFEAWEYTGNNDFEKVASFVNPTKGENQNGVPHCQTGDFDNDGFMEILFGDADGDVYIYENNGDNRYISTWQDSLPLLDATEFVAAGDFDGDGVAEFIAGCHSDPGVNTEHEYDSRHWYFRIYNRTEDNGYGIEAEYRFFGFESLKDFNSSVSCGDVDGDGKDEIFVCVFPDFYVIEQDESSQYGISYHRGSIQTVSSMIADTDMNGQMELWIGDGQFMQAFQAVGALTAPASPVGFAAAPLNEKSVEITWRAVTGAEKYLLSRGLSPQNLFPFQEIESPCYLDTSVIAGQYYYYQVLAVDLNTTPQQSLPSPIIAARPGARPFVLQAIVESQESVRILFSELMNESLKNPSHYIILPNDRHPTSVAIDASGQQAVLTSGTSFQAGVKYSVICSGLQDEDNTPMDTTRNKADFEWQENSRAPYLVSGQVISDKTIEIVFNVAMDKTTVETAVNYDAGSDVAIKSAELSDSDETRVQLQLQSETAFGALGRTWFIKVRNVKSADGVMIQAGRGDFLQFIFSRKNLSDVFTFPNPFVSNSGSDGITFANLPKQAEIRIMTQLGLHVRTIRETNGDGGVQWDLRNENGNAVAAGIYIYRVTADKESALGKLAIVR